MVGRGYGAYERGEAGRSTRGGNTIWLLVQSSQARTAGPEDVNEVSGIVENMLDRPPRDTFCVASGNRILCFVRLPNSDQMGFNRLSFLNSELSQAFGDEPGRGFEEISVVSKELVAGRVPEAVDAPARIDAR